MFAVILESLSALCTVNNPSKEPVVSDNLYPIDRFASEPLDVHKWSNHPEIKELVDTLYQDLSFNE